MTDRSCRDHGGAASAPGLFPFTGRNWRGARTMRAPRPFPFRPGARSRGGSRVRAHTRWWRPAAGHSAGGAPMQMDVILAAWHAAMRAKLGDLDMMDVEDMRVRAEELLDHGCDLYRAITGFATRVEIVRHDRDALACEGRWLAHALERELGLVRDLPERRDIDG